MRVISEATKTNEKVEEGLEGAKTWGITIVVGGLAVTIGFSVGRRRKGQKTRESDETVSGKVELSFDVPQSKDLPTERDTLERMLIIILQEIEAVIEMTADGREMNRDIMQRLRTLLQIVQGLLERERNKRK
jgi:hypothetical protein